MESNYSTVENWSKNDKNPPHANTTWTATDGDTGDLRGKP